MKGQDLDQNFGRELIEQLDGWVNELTVPLMPPRKVPEGDDRLRLEFKHHTPHTSWSGSWSVRLADSAPRFSSPRLGTWRSAPRY